MRAQVGSQVRPLVRAVVAALAGVAAAVTATVGRALNNGTGSGTAALTPADNSPQPAPKKSAQASKPATKQTSLPGRHIAAASDVPPGRAVQFTDSNGDPAWLLHETNGDLTAFSAVCTHAGCTVGLQGGEFVCPCHGGSYSASDGSVLGGPPPSPLPRLSIRVVNGDVREV